MSRMQRIVERGRRSSEQLRRDGDTRPAAAPVNSSAQGRPAQHHSSWDGRDRRLAAAPAFDHDSPLATHMRVLRSKLSEVMTANGWHTLGVASVTSHAQSALMAQNIACSFASMGKGGVRLVELNDPAQVADGLFNPQSPIFDSADAQTQRAHSAAFDVAGGCLNVFWPDATDSKLDLHAILGASRSHQTAPRITVVNLPPVLRADRLELLTETLDCMLLVVDANQDDQDGVSYSLDLIKSKPLVGTVMVTT